MCVIKAPHITKHSTEKGDEAHETLREGEDERDLTYVERRLSHEFGVLDLQNPSSATDIPKQMFGKYFPCFCLLECQVNLVKYMFVREA